jgi:hypothetical protein
VAKMRCEVALGDALTCSAGGINFLLHSSRFFAKKFAMPRGKKRSVQIASPPVSQRTRQGVQLAPWVLFFECIDGIDDLDDEKKQELKDKLQAKNLTDAFLPHMTASQLRKRLTISRDVADSFVVFMKAKQRAGLIEKDCHLLIPSTKDYDDIIAAIASNSAAGYGSKTLAIDDHFRRTNVMCHSGTLSKRMRPAVAGAKAPRARLSQASIDTISNLMYAATCDTNCKPLTTLRNFARAAALLEQFFGSQEEYLMQHKQPEECTERPRRPGGFFNEDQDNPVRIFVSPTAHIPEHDVQNDFSPFVPIQAATSSPRRVLEATPAQTPQREVWNPIPGFSPGLDGQDLVSAERPSVRPASRSVGVQMEADSAVQAQVDDASGDSGRDIDGDSDETESDSSDSDSSGGGDSGDDDEGGYQPSPAPEGRDISSFNFAWNGPMPSSKKTELSLRWPRKSQLRKMMKIYGWQAMKGQWVDMHRRSGSYPPMIRMYFHEKRMFMVRNQIVDTDQELNGDESLLRGDITEAARTMMFVICRGPSGCARDRHAYATKGATSDSYALVVFPVVSRNRCVFLQIILKGNPSPKAGSKTAQKQEELVRDVIACLPGPLQSICYCNFTTKGYQTAASFQDASRALIIALHNFETPGLGMSWSTPMASIPPLKRKYMFKVDGSKTHGISDHQFLLEIASRKLILFPYIPNATAFIQELDQLILLLFKRCSRRIVKLELAAMSERPDFRNRFVHLVWAENIASVNGVPVFKPVYEAESQENFSVSTAANPSGHVGLTHYEVAPEVCEIMNRIAERIDKPWGPVRLASMFGHALSAALLNPDVLKASFDAVLEERVFDRPLVVRELQYEQHLADLHQRKTDQLADLAVGMSGNLPRLVVPREAALPAGMVLNVIPDEKWDLFCSSILRTEGPQADIRGLCTIYSSFSAMYDEAHKRDGNVEAFQGILAGAGDADGHAAALQQEQQAAHDAAVTDFSTWIQQRVVKMASVQTDCANGRVLFRAYTESLAAMLAAIPPQQCSKQILKSFASQLKQLEKSQGKVRACIDSSRQDVSNLQQKVTDRKAMKFPNADRPLSPDVTGAFDTAAADVLSAATALSVDLQIAIQQESGFAEIRGRISDLPAPVPRAGRGRGRGPGPGRGGNDGGGGGGAGDGSGSDVAGE